MRNMFLIVMMVAVCSKANATGAIAGATEPTQIANNIQLVLSYAEQVQQTVTQLNQYQAMLTNLMKLTPSASLNQAAGQLFRDQNMLQSFNNLRSIVVGGQRISYSMSNLESQFKNLHPGYGNSGGTDYFRSYQNWSDTTLDSVKNSLSLVTAHSENFVSEEGMLNELMSNSNSAQGQMQALQAGNAIGVQMIGQMQKLRQLQMAQMQAQNAYIAGQQSAQDVKTQGIERFLGHIESKKIKQ